MAGLEELSHDILYLILGYLTTERLPTLRCLRSTSQRLSLFAESQLHRTIILEEGNGVKEQASFKYIERLLDPSDALRLQVRFLQVKSFNGDEESFCMNTRLLHECLRCIHKLDTFSWDAQVPLPSSLLGALQQYHPGAQLCVSVRQLEHEIVASAQLHGVSISIPCSDITSPNSSTPFEQVRDLLMHNHNVRALSIDAHLDWKLRDAAMEKLRGSQQTVLESYNLNPRADIPQRLIGSYVEEETPIPAIFAVQIPLKPTDQLPKLEVLAIKARTYGFDESHCQSLQRCIEWSRLKRLTLDCSDYGSFFDTFAYEKLQLEHLDVCCHMYFHPYLRSRPHTDDFSRFVSSLHKLKALAMRYNDTDLCHDFWPNLVGTHGDRLVHLSLKRHQTPYADNFCQDKLWNYLSSFTALKVLELEMPNSPFSKRAYCYHCRTDCSLGLMPYVPSLERLYVSTRVSANDEQSLHMQYTTHAHNVLERFWSFYTVQSGSCNLSSVDLRFWRIRNPSPRPRITRPSRSMGTSEITFESMRRDHQLVIKERSERKVVTTYYNEIRDKFVGTCIKVSYVATHQDQRERHH